MKEKARNVLIFYCNSFFSLKIAQTILFLAFLVELTSYLRKNIFFSEEKLNICHYHKKSSFLLEKWKFRWFSSYFIVFINNKQKTMNIATMYLLLKNFINDVFFNVIRNINGILQKTSFYKYNICNLYKDKIFA